LLKVLGGYNNSRELSMTGTVTLNGHMTTSEERRLSNLIGYVEQQEPFLDTMTVKEHLLFQVNANSV